MPDIPAQATTVITPETDLLPFSAPLLLDPETALLLAVRARLQRYLLVDVDQKDIHIELDEMAHPIMGPVGIIISPDGCSPGKAHPPDGGTVHEVFGIVVTVILRSTHISRDRWAHLLTNTDMYLAYNITLNQHIHRIRALIDFDYDLINHATALMAANNETRQGYEEPLLWLSQDRRPRAVGPEVFSASNRAQTMSTEKTAGIAKSVYFGNCSRYTVRENRTT